MISLETLRLYATLRQLGVKIVVVTGRVEGGYTANGVGVEAVRLPATAIIFAFGD